MSAKEIIDIKFESLKKEIESTLLSPVPKNDKDQEYWTANFKGWILIPFIEKTKTEITNLPFNEYLVNKLNNLIDDLDLFLNEKLSRVSTRRNYKFQKSYLIRYISELTEIRSTLKTYLLKEEDSTDLSRSNTVLTRDETSLLILYLQDSKLIQPHGSISDSKLCDAFEILTGYKKEQLRKSISGQSRIHKNELSTNLNHFNKLKETLRAIIKQIDKDIASFN